MSLLSNHRKTAFVVLATIVGVVAVIALATLQYRAISDYRLLGETKVLVSDIQSNILTLRRNEKDFMARKNLLYRQRFLDNYGVILENVQNLGSVLRTDDAEDPKVAHLVQIFDDYKSKFLAIVELQKQIGFHHEDGFYGSMREAIHGVEDILEAMQQNRLLKDMLMLRRQEKDFMLRKDIKYLEKFDQDIRVMRSNLSRAYLDNRARRDIFSALAAYEKDFKALVSATQEMGFTSEEGLHGAMRNRIHQSEGILNELRQDVLLLESDAGSRMINMVIISAVVLTLLVGALIRI